MHRLLALSLAAFSTAIGASAQTYIADPIDNPASSTSQNIPLGLGTSWDEARSHFFFPAQFLPGTGGLITGIEFSMSTTNTVPYQLLEFSLDHTTNPGLSMTFASNLTAPQVCYSAVNQNVSFTQGWSQFVFTNPFVYDGTSNLVIETRKIIDRPAGPTGAAAPRVVVYPRRADTVPPIWAYSSFGGGGSSATTATTTYSTELLTRLIFANSPTLTIDSTRDVTGNPNRAYYHIGATITVANHGTPSSPYATFFEASTFSAGIPIPGIGGALWLSSLNYLIDSGALDGSGNSSFSAAIPSDPSLIGLQAYLQSIILGATIDFTNVVKAPVAAY